MSQQVETRSWWTRLAAGVVGVVAGAVILLKIFLGKLVFIAVVWAGIVWAARFGGWVGILLIVAIVIAAIAWGKAHIS
jgi:hypothetical protein